jgi:hypothetical protein
MLPSIIGGPTGCLNLDFIGDLRSDLVDQHCGSAVNDPIAEIGAFGPQPS